MFSHHMCWIGTLISNALILCNILGFREKGFCILHSCIHGWTGGLQILCIFVIPSKPDVIAVLVIRLTGSYGKTAVPYH